MTLAHVAFFFGCVVVECALAAPIAAGERAGLWDFLHEMQGAPRRRP